MPYRNIRKHKNQMIIKETTTDYWFTIEPYVFVGMTDQCVLLYNTLDGVAIESNSIEVIKLLKETLREANCGVILLPDERYQQKEVNAFIRELRYNYMGDIIDVALSKGKPVQLLPYTNFSDKLKENKSRNVSPHKNVLENLSEINVRVGHTVNRTKLISFLQSLPGQPTFNIAGNIAEVTNYGELLSFFDQHLSPKNIVCSYTDVIALEPDFKHNFLYRISVRFPINTQQWDNSLQILCNQALPFEYVFDVTSVDDCQQADQLIEQYGIEQYRLNPVYTGDNLGFFEDNVFLTKEDILSTSMTIKDFFARQAMNIYDFGKINIMPNGDAYANVNHPALGNIYTDSIYEIVYKEMEEGQSWFRIRNQVPCSNCVYQWLCPSPADYEIAIGRPNLCHVK